MAYTSSYFLYNLYSPASSVAKIRFASLSLHIKRICPGHLPNPETKLRTYADLHGGTTTKSAIACTNDTALLPHFNKTALRAILLYRRAGVPHA